MSAITTKYMLVVQGRYMLIINEDRIPVNAGEEYFILQGVAHSGEVVAGTRTMRAFGGIGLTGCRIAESRPSI